LQTVYDHQGARRRGGQPLYDVISAYGVGTIGFKQPVETRPFDADSVETIQHILFGLLQREEHTSIAGLHGFHGKFETHQRFALARVCAYQH